MNTVGYLHTAPVHVPVFEQLSHAVSPDVRCVHRVAPELLEQAAGEQAPEKLQQNIDKALQTLVGDGAQIIGCTCSTLGEWVEGRLVNGVSVQRIDRAAADQIMTFDQVLVLTALASASLAAEKLLQSSAEQQSSATHWDVCLVPGAWAQFQAGELEAYQTCIAEFVNKKSAGYDAVFLAQASMRGAVEHCHHATVLTSPEPGVARLLAGLSGQVC